MSNGRFGICVPLLSIAIASGCALTGPSLHVRDGLGLFSADARAEAEERLCEIASDRGVVMYVVTDPQADPPRMLDAPMADAEARGLPAVAVLVGPNGIVGVGSSHEQYSDFDPPSASSRLLEEGRADQALDLLVDHVAAWSPAP